MEKCAGRIGGIILFVREIARYVFYGNACRVVDDGQMRGGCKSVFLYFIRDSSVLGSMIIFRVNYSGCI